MAIAATLVGTRGTTGNNTVTTTSGTTSASGSTFAFFVSYDATAGSITTAGDNKGNTYTAQGTPQADTSGGLGQWYVCENGVGGAGHTATFTTASNHYGVLHLFEITGATSAPLDKIGQGQDFSTPYGITTSTLSQADEAILVGVMCQESGSGAYASSNTTLISQEDDESSYWTSCVGRMIVSSTSAVTPSFTKATATSPAGLSYVTFKEGSGAPSVPDSLLTMPPMMPPMGARR